VAGIVLSLLVLAINALSETTGKEAALRLATISYLDNVRPEIQTSNQQGAELADLRERATELGRATVTERLQRVGVEALAVVREVEEADPPPELRTNHSLLVASLAIRARSADAIRRTIAEALNPGSPPPAATDLVRATEDLRSADRTYELFRDALPKERDTAMPKSSWLQGSQPLSAEEAAAFISTLHSSAALAPIRDVAVVTITMDPAPVGMEGPATVIPLAPTLRLQVVVANVGNDAIRQLPVVAMIGAPDGDIDTARQFVDLEPGQRATVTIGGLRLAGGLPNLLKVTAGPVDGEATLSDNDQQRTLVVRGEPVAAPTGTPE
jgi:hypothetical protein